MAFLLNKFMGFCCFYHFGGGGKQAKGNNEDKGKLVPPPGQLSLLGFLHTAKVKN